MKVIWLGASLAATLALGALVVGRRLVRRRARGAERGSGVLGVIVKAALLSAAQTAAQIGVARLLAKVLPHAAAETPVAGPSE